MLKGVPAPLPRGVTLDDDGEAVALAASRMCGRFMQNVAMQAFQDLGGQERFNVWAADNYTVFAKSFLARMLPRENPTPPTKDKSLEDMIEALDASMVDVTPEEQD